MNYIWAGIMLISIACAIITGRINILSNAVLVGAGEAVSLLISLLGMMALWTGFMKIAEKSGMTAFLSRIFSPVINFLFPDCPPGSAAANGICMNITANLLGLGNAATPFGINAIKEMQKNNHHKTTATNSMIMFLVVNTASLQLIPTTLCILRQKHGSQNPMNILLPLWFTTILALIIGVTFAKIFEKVQKKDNE